METLEILTRHLHKQGVVENGIESRLHVAGMLAFVDASRKVMSEHVMPTSLFRMLYDQEAQNLSFEVLEGHAPVPRPDALTINTLELLQVSFLKENMPLLWEGKTGTGKTYTTEQLMKTVLPEENYAFLRLNNNMSNVLQPYIRTEINGSVQQFLRNEQLDRIAAIFIDEVNRGDDNQVLQLQDGIITLPTGERGRIGVPIPVYSPGGWSSRREHKRPVVVTSAQNPPMTKDPKYGSAKRPDAARGNRDIQVDVPNDASADGGSLLLLEEGRSLHKKFRDHYKQGLARLLDIDGSQLASLDRDYIEFYAFCTDPNKNVCPNTQSAVEFFDAIMVLSSPDISRRFSMDKRDSVAWNGILKGYGVDFSYDGDVNADSKAMQKLRQITQSFKEEMIKRDIRKAKKLSDSVSLIRRVKGALKEKDPVTAYLRKPNYITVQDVACGFAITLHDKQDTHEHDPVSLIDTVLKEYVSVTEAFAARLAYGKTRFDENDPNMAVYSLAYQHAVKETCKIPELISRAKDNANTVKNPYVRVFIRDLGNSVNELKRMENGNEYRKPILARMISDLSTLAGFADEYQDRLEPLMAGLKDPAKCIKAFRDFYREARAEGAEDIYLKRLRRVLGV